jgi:hypothetical protein
MSSQICLFDVLPAELVYTLFNYFWCDEILRSFFEINDHINNLIYSYSSHRINFQSILKCDFEKICRLIRTDQVISLRLCDDDTPLQSQLFFTYFDIEQLTRLRSISLSNVDINSFELILPKLNKLKQLRSVSIHCDNIVEKYLQRLINNPIKSLLSLIPPEVSIQLNRLNLGPGINFQGSVLPINLRYLIIEKSNVGNLQMILSQISELILLNISLEVGRSNIGQICASSSLRWLILKITGKDSFNQLFSD